MSSKALLSMFGGFLALTGCLAAQETQITVRPEKVGREFQGMGCGEIYYEGHVTSLAARGKNAEQERLYDAMFGAVRTDFLHLFIRPDHEPVNDNTDPFKPEFRDENFGYCAHTLAICAAARKRRPGIRLYASLYSPPGWMKTNNDPGGGGEARATLKPGMEQELGEYCWAFLDYMRRHGYPVEFLSIANECDWPHSQPGYFLTPQAHAELFAKVATHLGEMKRRHPGTPCPKLVAPNVLSAVDCAGRYLPPLLALAGSRVDVIGSHDYDRRGHRWKTLVEAAGGRPVWCTEWCVNGADTSPGLLNSASEFWLAMSEAFNGGANVWMAYDWVYPPRQGGEALIHVDWGSGFQLTKIYHAFRQWCAPLAPGMRSVATDVTGQFASDISKPGVKAAAFISRDRRRLVVYAGAVQGEPAAISLVVGGGFGNSPLRRTRTSANENCAMLPPARMDKGTFHETLPPRGMETFELTAP
jgi:O-glycosyl hydrolase